MHITIHPFFESTSGSFSFVVANPESKTCAVIDAALGIAEADDDMKLNTDCADQILDWIDAHGFVARWILETHVHADRPSASGYLKSKLLCAQTAIGANTPDVKGYDKLFQEGDKICLGHTCGRVLETPGHTPGCISYHFEGVLFIGDTLFMPDTGTARCDFPGGCATTLFSSIQRILSLPGDTRLFVCHDYGVDSSGAPRRSRFVTTVDEQRRQNIHVGHAAHAASFVNVRSARDATLSAPRWSHFSIPANLECMGLKNIDSLMTQSLGSRSH
ncbi:MAG: MBL fold metallo-hydrolase [Pseudomonadota bacterium]